MGFGKGKKTASTVPQSAKGIQIPSSTYGDVIPVGYGEFLAAMHLLWSDFFRSDSASGASTGSKKGGQSANYQFIYHVAVALGFFEGDRGNWDNAHRTSEHVTIGLMRPGRRTVSVRESVAFQGQYADGGALGPNGALQPIRGTEPGALRGKRVRHIGNDTGAHPNFPNMPFFEFAPGVFIAPVGTILTDAFTGTQKTKLTTPGLWPGSHPSRSFYAPEIYPNIAWMLHTHLFLGSNASLPSISIPGARMRFGDCDAGGFVAGATDGTGIRDCAPDHILSDAIVNWKHGVAGEIFLPFLPGYDPTLLDASLFWKTDGVNETWWAYVRANDMQLSPLYDSQRAFHDIVDELALVTDSTPLWSEGVLKMIPYGDTSVTSPRTGITFTPLTDGTTYTAGANIGALPLTLDDFLPSAGDPLVVARKAIRPDTQSSAGYFNHVRLEWMNRLNAYAKEVVEVKDEASINRYGLIARQPDSLPLICDAALAKAVATRILKRFGQKRNTYQFTLGYWHTLLDVMDCRLIPGEAIDPNLTGTMIPVRFTAISENENFDLVCEAEEYPSAVPAITPDMVPTEDAGPADLGGMIVGGNWSTFASCKENPWYVDPAGAISSDWVCNDGPAQYPPAAKTAGDTTGGIGAPGQSEYVAPVDMRITSWAVDYTVREDPSFDTAGAVPHAQTGKARLRLSVAGVSTPFDDVELTFDWNDIGASRLAVNDILIPRNTTFTVEITYLDGAGGEMPPFTLYAQQAFNWTMGWEPA